MFSKRVVVKFGDGQPSALSVRSVSCFPLSVLPSEAYLDLESLLERVPLSLQIVASPECNLEHG